MKTIKILNNNEIIELYKKALVHAHGVEKANEYSVIYDGGWVRIYNKGYCLTPVRLSRLREMTETLLKRPESANLGHGGTHE